MKLCEHHLTLVLDRRGNSEETLEESDPRDCELRDESTHDLGPCRVPISRSTHYLFACMSNRYGLWYVESHSREGVFYLLEYGNAGVPIPGFRENWYCECPAFLHRTHELCKHIKSKIHLKCDWDQKLGRSPVRKKTGELSCPVCGGGVYKYVPLPDENSEF